MAKGREPETPIGEGFRVVFENKTDAYESDPGEEKYMLYEVRVPNDSEVNGNGSEVDENGEESDNFTPHYVWGINLADACRVYAELNLGITVKTVSAKEQMEWMREQMKKLKNSASV